MNTRALRCANCRTDIEPRAHNRFFPFCSERCKMEDLGKWLNEEYTVPVTQDGTERILREAQETPRPEAANQDDEL